MTKDDCCGRGCPGCIDGYSADELLSAALLELEVNLSHYREDGGPADYLQGHVDKLDAAIKMLTAQWKKEVNTRG